METVTHVGGFVVKKSHRGNGIASMMADEADKMLATPFYVAALNPQTIRMCEARGMTEIDGRLFVKE